MAKRNNARRKVRQDEPTAFGAEEAAAALYFLHNVQPLDGCDYSDDERFEWGRTILLMWIEETVRAAAEGAQS